MSAETSPEADQGVEEPLQPACDTSLLSGEWETQDASKWPTGYPRLCEECFADLVPAEAWRDDGTAAWDHLEACTEFVRSSECGHARVMHRPRDA